MGMSFSIFLLFMLIYIQYHCSAPQSTMTELASKLPFNSNDSLLISFIKIPFYSQVNYSIIQQVMTNNTLVITHLFPFLDLRSCVCYVVCVHMCIRYMCIDIICAGIFICTRVCVMIYSMCVCVLLYVLYACVCVHMYIHTVCVL